MSIPNFLPLNLRLARRSVRVSQTLAAEVLGTTRQVIGAFEATKKEPREPRVGEILALASLYRISPEVILTTDLRTARTPRHRPAALERRDADDADDALDAWELEEAAGVRSGLVKQPMVPPGVFDVQTAVEQLRGVLGLDAEPPFDVFSGLTRAGFILEFTALKSLAGALIPRDGDRPPVIVVNSDQPDDRLRWTAAHEAAHWILQHHPRQAHTDPFGPSRDAKEWAADAVAGELLAPRDAFAAAFASRDRAEPLADAVYRISRRFGTSYAAAAVRAGQLRLISPDTVTALRAEKPTEIEARLGLRSGIPFDVDIAVPAVIASLVGTGAIDPGWAGVFGSADGQRTLRSIQRAAIAAYFEDVPEPARVTGVTQVFEATARWIALRHRIVAA